jgi:two-component system sensor histidine kinase HydH
MDLLTGVIQNLEEPVRVLKPGLEIVLANRAAANMQGLDPSALVGSRCDGALPGRCEKCDYCLVEASFEDGSGRRAQMTGIDANGDRWVTEIQTKPILDKRGQATHVIETFRDKSREKRLERQLLQSSKLVSIGELATGIAHEIRNPLSGVRLGLDALKPCVSDSEEGLEILQDITRDVVRLDRVVTDLLNFTKPKPHRPEWFRVEPLFGQVYRLVRKGAHAQAIHIDMSVDPADLEIWADRNQIHQVLINVLLNSVQAMEGGGEIRLSAGFSENINWSADRPDKRGYRIVIKDTGKGIPEEEMHRLFDPFFTTKPNGTGVGLTTSLSIVRKHNGELRINSKPGEGTTAQILLPEGPGEAER